MLLGVPNCSSYGAEINSDYAVWPTRLIRVVLIAGRSPSALPLRLDFFVGDRRFRIAANLQISIAQNLRRHPESIHRKDKRQSGADLTSSSSRATSGFHEPTNKHDSRSPEHRRTRARASQARAWPGSQRVPPEKERPVKPAASIRTSLSYGDTYRNMRSCS